MQKVYTLDENFAYENKKWFKSYQNFISEFCDISLMYGVVKIEFISVVPKRFPGDEEGVTVLPWLIKLSTRVRTCLKQNVFLDEGLYILFRQIAFIEFWHDNIFWIFLWLWNKKIWRKRANERASQLLRMWKEKKC